MQRWNPTQVLVTNNKNMSLEPFLKIWNESDSTFDDKQRFIMCGKGTPFLQTYLESISLEPSKRNAITIQKAFLLADHGEEIPPSTPQEVGWYKGAEDLVSILKREESSIDAHKDATESFFRLTAAMQASSSDVMRSFMEERIYLLHLRRNHATSFSLEDQLLDVETQFTSLLSDLARCGISEEEGRRQLEEGR